MLYVVMIFLLLSACTSTNTHFKDDLRIRSVSQTNTLTPSMSVLEVSVCDSNQGLVGEDDENTCQGSYVPFALVHGSQPGALTGLMNAVVTGGAVVGSSYLLADGIRDSATRISQTGGGATSGSDSVATSNSTSAADTTNNLTNSQSQHQNQTQSRWGH